MAKGYVDVIDLNAAKIFAGAGIGWSNIKTKPVYSSRDIKIIEDGVETKCYGQTVGLRKHNLQSNKTNLAFSAAVGASFEFETGTIDVRYEYVSHGKTDEKTYEDKDTKAKMKYGSTSITSHNIVFGVRAPL